MVISVLIVIFGKKYDMEDINTKTFTPLLLPENKTDKQIKSDEKYPNRWKPGESGNLKGRPKRKTLTEYIIEELDKPLPSGATGYENLARLIMQMVINQKRGDIIKELWHYLDGMPTQKHEHEGNMNVNIGMVSYTNTKNE
jgi:hypothetical protein